MSGPVRTCIGCRTRADQSALLRLVWNGTELVIDEHSRQPGRGAYLHPRIECLTRAVRKRVIGRALRVDAVPAAELERVVRLDPA